MSTINVPYVAAMAATATGQLETVKQESHSFTGDADIVYTGSLSQDIINAFVLSQEEAGATGVDLSVAMTSDTAKIDAFKAAMKAAIEGAAFSSEASALVAPYAVASDNLKGYLEKWVRKEIDSDLSSNTIPDELEAQAIKSVVVDISAAAADGALNMWNGMVALGQDLRDLIATQLPSSNYSPEEFSDALPVAAGDKMVFRFTISTTATITESAQDVTGANGTAGSGPGVNAAHYTVSTRLLELQLTKA